MHFTRLGISIPELAHEFELSDQTIRNRVKQYESDAGRRQNGITSDKKVDLRQLRKEHRRLRQGRQIQQQAAAWFAQEPNSTTSDGSSNL